MALDIFSFDDVRTGNGRMAIEFLDSSVVRLTELSKIVIDEFVYDPESELGLKWEPRVDEILEIYSNNGYKLEGTDLPKLYHKQIKHTLIAPL